MTSDNLAEIKSLLVGLGTKVGEFDTKFDSLDSKFTHLLTEVKSEVSRVKLDLEKNTR